MTIFLQLKRKKKKNDAFFCIKLFTSIFLTFNCWQTSDDAALWQSNKDLSKSSVTAHQVAVNLYFLDILHNFFSFHTNCFCSFAAFQLKSQIFFCTVVFITTKSCTFFSFLKTSERAVNNCDRFG